VAPVAPAASAPAAPVVSASKVTLAEVGLEATALDRSADPCVDFYQFACGGWLAANPVPPDRGRWARSSEIEDHVQAALRDILDDAARGADPATKQLGDFYASCLDEAAADKAGIAALRPVLDKVLGVREAWSWQVAMVELHKLGLAALWELEVVPDGKDYVIQLAAAGFALPPDYYARPLDGYRTHVARMLALVGVKGDAAAGDVIAIESELAKLAPRPGDRKVYPADAAAAATALRGLGVPKGAQVVMLGGPKLLAQLELVRGKFTFVQWARYFTYHLLIGLPLPKPFDDEALELRKLVHGVEKQPERGKRCIAAAGRALGDQLAQLYTARHVPAASKQAAAQLVEALVKAAGEDKPRVSGVARMVGAPDASAPASVDVRRGDHLGNVLRARVAAEKRQLARAGTPVDRTAWPVEAFAAHAVYDPTLNELVIPAGMLQPPWFGPERSAAANLGGLGVLIARELARAAELSTPVCVAEQFATFEVLPKQPLQPRLVQAEATADLAGARLAFRAFRSARAGVAKPVVADGFTEDQQFFLAVAQASCSRDRTAEAQRRLVTDPHPPPQFRVYGSLRNMKEFAEAFRCAPGTPMRPAQTCSVW